MFSPTGYVDQDPSALRLTLVEGELSRDAFSLYAGCTHETTGFSVDAAVIGASHVITFSGEGWQLHEVFACVQLDGVGHVGLDELVNGPVRRELHGMRYRFTAHRIPWQGPEPSDVVDAARLVAAMHQNPHTNEFGVLREFPAEEGGTVTPKTIIFGHANENGVAIQTFHSYPNVRGLVMSRTVLTYDTER